MTDQTADAGTGTSTEGPGTEGPATTRARNLIAVALVVAVVLAGASSLPSQVHLPRDSRGVLATVQTIAPQGWAFFTRDPREPLVVPYTQDGEEWQNVSRGPNAQVEHLFGANRSSRLTEFDTELVLGEVDPGTEWIDCGTAAVDECARTVRDTSEIIDATTTGWDLRLCGPVLLVQEHPVPFAYAQLGGSPQHEGLLFDVRCEQADA